MTMAKLRVTWSNGDVQEDEIPADVYDKLGEARVKQILEEKFKRKILKIQRLDKPSTTQSGAPQSSSQSDRDASSQTAPQQPDSKPTAGTPGPNSRDEEPDYRDKFPDKYTPKNMRRNKWGELIYE